MRFPLACQADDRALDAFPVQVLLRAVQMSYMIKNPKDTRKLVRLAATFALPTDEYVDFCSRLDSGKIRLPGRSCIYKLRTKLDWFGMLWQRRLFNKVVGDDAARERWISHFSGDSSPKAGYDYMNIVEDRFIVTGSAADIAAACERDGISAVCQWQRRTMPVTVLGAGFTSAAAKFSKFLHVLVLETGRENLPQRRGTVNSWLADQGVDLAVGDVPDFEGEVHEVIQRLQSGDEAWQSDRARDVYFLPNSMTTADSLHAIFNALSDAFMSSMEWPRFEPIFRDLVHFMGDKKLRDRFLAVCMCDATPAERQLFHQFEGSRFEWRFWGNLEDQTFQLGALWTTFAKFWNSAAMTKDGQLSSSLIRIVSRAVANEPGDLVGVHCMLAAASVASQAVGHGARWLRGCRCHSNMILTNPTYTRRRRFMKDMEMGDDGICLWAGRNAPSLALGAIEDICKVIETADSDLLRQTLADSSEVVRVVALRFLQHVKDRLCSQLRAKFQFWLELPHMVAGLFGVYFGYTLRRCQRHGRQILAKLRGADQGELHRVAVRMLSDEILMAPPTIANDIPHSLKSFLDIRFISCCFFWTPLADKCFRNSLLLESDSSCCVGRVRVDLRFL